MATGRCLGEIIRREDGTVEYTHGYLWPAGAPEKALLEPCPEPIVGDGAGLAGCGVSCIHHCGAPITADWIGYGEDHGDDVRRNYREWL